MKKLFILISIIFLAGCATPYVFNVEKANEYLMSHKERPAHIKEAISVGKLARGMNEEEVNICWGKPDSIEKRAMPDHEVTIWRYLINKTVGHTFRGSITRKKIAKEVRFRNGTVITWREFNSPS